MQSDSARLKHRPEIDGLRAIAVLPVILFHAGFEAFHGGYVGVDVFFVISGYLITSIIAADVEKGTFSLAAFYERRARRILPALFLVVIASVPFAWAWLTPADMKDFSQSVAAVALFVSNVLFWRESGYFQAEAMLKPLLHTWSLAVEEQFYLLFPVFFLIAWRLAGAKAVRFLVVLGVISLAVAEWGAHNKPAATYLLLPTRAWEVVLGAVLALLHRRSADDAANENSGRWWRDLAAIAGLGMIAWSALSFDQRTLFPGLAALIPTVGTVLTIHYARPTTLAGRFLATPTLVGVGLISYSAYLWQQPLFAFARQRNLWEPSASVMALLSVFTLVLAYGSWRFVEQPFRSRAWIGRKPFVIASVMATLSLTAFGLFGHLTNGDYFRRAVAHTEANIDQQLRVNQGLSIACDGAFTLNPLCRTSDHPDLLLWGDSHAMHLAQGLITSRPDIKMIQFTRSVCAPILDMAPVSGRTPESWARECIATNDSVLSWLRKTRTIRYAVLGSPFTQYLGADARALLRDGSVVPAQALVAEYLLNTIRQLEALGIHVVVFSSPPANGGDIGRCLKNAYRFEQPYERCNFSAAAADAQQAGLRSLLREVAAHSSVVWLADGICDHGICRAAVDSTFIYRDYGHLTQEGSALLGRKMNFFARVTDTTGPR